jgi:hypothetical protein
MNLVTLRATQASTLALIMFHTPASFNLRLFLVPCQVVASNFYFISQLK